VAFSITGLGLLLAPLLNYFGIGCIVVNALIGWIGLAIAILGISVRLWANRTLGASYMRTLAVAENQSIVQKGPYRVIRHPGYLGSILMWVGAGLATTNWIAVAVTVSVMIAAYYYRILAEENLLKAAAGKEYSEYKGHTWKPIPFLF
jgi:protein-S-isoprenylcysteine O-methyltransferase Ste14